MKKIFFLSVIMCLFFTSFDYQQDFNKEEAYSKYGSYEFATIRDDDTNVYLVSKANGVNDKAIFYEGTQITDFVYNGMVNSSDSIILTKVVNGTEIYGLFDTTINKEILPFEYKNITQEYYNNVIYYNVQTFANETELYISKSYYDKVKKDCAEFEIKGENLGDVIKINSINDIPFLYIGEKHEIIGAPDYFYVDAFVYYAIINKDGVPVNNYLLSLDNKMTKYGTLDVEYDFKAFIPDYSVLNSEMQEIIPVRSRIGLNVMGYNDKEYIINNSYTAYTEYYDFDGNKIEDINAYLGIGDIEASNWAKQSIEDALVFNVIPEDLQNNYKQNITREEFCELAVQTLIIYNELHRNYDIDLEAQMENAKSPFVDTNSKSVALAYELGIVKGTSKNTFSPDNEITRQEAAVMLTNLAPYMSLNLNVNTVKYSDDSYFADWAKDSIYKISGKVSNGNVIMAGTEANKFSPWYQYSREQAIVTMMRMLSHYA